MSDINVNSDPIEITVEEQNLTITVTGGRGPVGPQGAAGSGEGIETTIFNQAIPSAHWIITHAWPGGYPSVTVVDSAGDVIYGDVNYVSPTRVDVLFDAPFSGKAYLN